jgi:hypothetical protein
MALPTTVNRTTEPDATAEAAAEASAWLGQQLRWERRLAELHAKSGATSHAGSVVRLRTTPATAGALGAPLSKCS